MGDQGSADASDRLREAADDTIALETEGEGQRFAEVEEADVAAAIGWGGAGFSAPGLLRRCPRDRPGQFSTSLHEIVRTTKQRWRNERGYQDLNGELGLDHFEGRMYPGWQHHISVVLLATRLS